ncbi:MAG TPA: PA14 domain-containing protein, partial [Sedimentisphaerales bacterium]|nr:PA14 domain-containing protein [Sedimentisphaerales bacterium]
VSGQSRQLTLQYAWGGPSEQNLSEAITTAKLGGDHFGMIAKTHLLLSAGTWEFTTLSDDGVRVLVDGKPVIENWAWHGPTRDVGQLTLTDDKTIQIVVEHFEIDGYSVLELGISRKSEPVSEP